MSYSKIDPKAATFIAGKQADTMNAVELDKRLVTYRKHEAKLQDLFKKKLLRNSPLNSSSNVSKFIRTYGTKTAAQYQESELRRLVDDVAGVVHDLGEIADDLKLTKDLAAKQGTIGTKGSPSYKSAEQLVRDIERKMPKFHDAVREIRIPKAGDKRQISLKEACDACAAVLTAAVVAKGILIVIKKYLSTKK